MADSTWWNFEDVARYLLNRFAEHFGLERVERKREILGAFPPSKGIGSTIRERASFS